MYSGTRKVRLPAKPAGFKPDLSSTSRARQSLAFAQKNLKPEEVASVEQQVQTEFPDMLIGRRRPA